MSLYARESAFILAIGLHTKEAAPFDLVISFDKALQLFCLFNRDRDLRIEPRLSDQGCKQRTKLFPSRMMEEALVDKRLVGFMIQAWPDCLLLQRRKWKRGCKRGRDGWYRK